MALVSARVVHPGEIDPIDRPDTDPGQYPLRFLAEGDSWFSYGSWKFQSLLTQLRLTRPSIVLSLAEPGRLLTAMADLAANVALRNWLSRGFGAYAWNALLVSGGGNDVIAEVKAGHIVRARDVAPASDLPAAQYVDGGALRATLDRVREGYARIVALRDAPGSPCPGVPLVTHAYDFATPRPAPAQFLVPLLGPWLFPAMAAAKIPEERWNDVSDHILRELAAALIALEGELPNFHVARSQGTLVRAALGATGTSHDWANEIHPTGGGYRKIAARLAEPLEALT
jgi:hypothetical protein